MANSFQFADIWARKQQDFFEKKSVAMVMADTSFRSDLQHGKTLKRNYSNVSANEVPDVIVRGTDMAITDVSETTETLTVNKEYGKALQIHDFDELQSSYGLALEYGRQYGTIMTAQIDADVLGEVVNALSTVDAGDVGGTAGQGITLTSSNVINMFTSATKKLSRANVMDTDKIGIVSPEVEEQISLFYGIKATDYGDEVSKNGFFSKMSGYELYTSNNLTGSAVLALATNPTANDTVTIQGVTFTFVSSIGSTAGNVLIGVSADATRANLAGLINNPATTSATQVALSTANAKVFAARVTAVNNDTSDTLTVVYKGAGGLVVSETLTAGADVWTAALVKTLCAFGVKNKMTTLAMQKKPTISVRKAQLQLADNILNGMLYGVKTFKDNAQRMVKVEVKFS